MHFDVLVVTKDAEGVGAALHPFWDNDAEDGRQPHFVFVDDPFDPPAGDPDPETGRFGWWANPLGKWDGWTSACAWRSVLKPDAPMPPDLDRDGSRCRARALQAILREDPEGQPRVFALLVHGVWSDAEHKSLAAWRREIRRTLQALDPEDWVTLVDCHH